MWNSTGQYQRNKGLSLIELILGIGLISLVIIIIFTLLNYSNKALNRAEYMDEVISNGRFGQEYMKGEVLMAEKILASSKIQDLDYKYPTNIGFVLMIENGNNVNYVTYYLKNDELIRIACEGSNKTYPSENKFKGFNQICTNVISFANTLIDIDNKVLSLNLQVGSGDKVVMEFKSTIYLRSLIDF